MSREKIYPNTFPWCYRAVRVSLTRSSAVRLCDRLRDTAECVFSAFRVSQITHRYDNDSKQQLAECCQ